MSSVVQDGREGKATSKGGQERLNGASEVFSLALSMHSNRRMARPAILLRRQEDGHAERRHGHSDCGADKISPDPAALSVCIARIIPEKSITDTSFQV